MLLNSNAFAATIGMARPRWSVEGECGFEGGHAQVMAGWVGVEPVEGRAARTAVQANTQPPKPSQQLAPRRCKHTHTLALSARVLRVAGGGCSSPVTIHTSRLAFAEWYADVDAG